MKRVLPTLLLVMTLPSSFSIAQESSQLSPFDRYLKGLRTGRLETALVRVAALCGMNLNAATIRYAVRPDERWKPVRNLGNARDNQETDFFATAEVLHSPKRILVEEWSMDSEAGDETRTIICLLDQDVKYGEQIEWSSPQEEERTGTSKPPGWAHEVRWRVEQGKFLKSILEQFVNEQEKPVPKPRLGPDTPKVFGFIPEIRTWGDLKLPDTMLL